MLNKIYFSLILIFSLIGSLTAQELNISVTVEAPQLNTTDPRVIKLMEKEIEEFLNTTRWTDDEFEPEERIEGNLLIAISGENGANNFTSDFTIQAIRPIFQSSNKTKLLNYKDPGVSFSYIDNQPIRNSEEKYFDNLSSILTFYANLIIGLDYDSFSKYGGEKYFTIANNLIQSLPSNVQTTRGWSPADGNKKRSRYWMLENILNPRLKVYREAMYTYHRKGLDIMHEDMGKGKAIVMSSLKTIERANDAYPNAMIIQMFSDSKNDELLEIFIPSERAEKIKVYDILVAIDPYRAGKYNKLRR